MVIKATSKKTKFTDKILNDALPGRLAVKKLHKAKQRIPVAVYDIKMTGFS